MKTNTNKTLSQFDITILVISFVIGMGIFGTPARVAAAAGSPAIFFSVWIFFGFVSLCGALAFAEIGLRFTEMGGFYKIFAKAYHPSIGFSINILMLISNAASVGVVALIGADYISDFLYGGPSVNLFNIIVAILSVLLFFAVNLFGLRSSSRIQNFMMLLKIGLIILMIASVFKNNVIEPRGYMEDVQIYKYKDNHWLKLFLLAMIPVAFSYGGYQQTINFGAEIRNPKNLPKAIIGGITLVILFYVLLNYAYTTTVGFEEMKGASAVGSLLCEAWFGSYGAKIFDGLMFLSVLAYVNVALMSNPRVMFAMGKDRVIPGFFSYQHPKTNVFTNGLSLFVLMVVAIIIIGKDIDKIMTFNMFLESLGLALAAATIYYFRKEHDKKLKARWTYITPYTTAFYILTYVFVIISVTIKSPTGSMLAILLMTGLFMIFFITRKLNQKRKNN
ncbi:MULTISPECIES: APC family permease [Weeksellaceae]|uniref:APC family permease n=1 Tax=Weeksellaceae TaxID=2762318 RepID=UPI0004807A34|nr:MULTISPECIES: amino acid permease [Weeksellaceae]KUG10609.1 hypothetical protein AMC91_16480 [Elizabethkingia miricola]